MKSISKCLGSLPQTATVAALLLAIFVSAPSLGQSASSNKIGYKIVDLGTLGGPVSYGSVNGDGARLLNDSGMIAERVAQPLRGAKATRSRLREISNCSCLPID